MSIPLLDGGFFETLDFLVMLLDFFLIYSRWLYPDVIANKLVAILVDVAIMFLFVIPFSVARWGIFLVLFGFAFFWGFQPWTWGQEAQSELDKKGGPTVGQPYSAKDHEF